MHDARGMHLIANYLGNAHFERVSIAFIITRDTSRIRKFKHVRNGRERQRDAADCISITFLIIMYIIS